MRHAQGIPRRLVTHEARAQTLETLGRLLGCHRDLRFALPDRSLPDVLLASIDGAVAFLGEAKNTETPGCTASRARIRRYIFWMDGLPGLSTVIACVCYGPWQHGAGWLALLRDELRTTGYRVGRAAVSAAPGGCRVACVLGLVTPSPGCVSSGSPARRSPPPPPSRRPTPRSPT